ncbi:MAG: hypothetical protein HUJ75_01745 [Parasporobacterium sp.]|nr:hypothetical protein [Parasporobacterium sp.]
MREVRISDVTMIQRASAKDISLTFKEKLEVAKLLDKLGVSVIEAEGIDQVKIDSLRIKSMASAVKNSVLAVPLTEITTECADITWAALKEARRPRLQVRAAVSPAQIEYIHHMKADKMIDAVAAAISHCAGLTSDVEFIADDATRSDEDFLYKIIDCAISAGATTVTVADAAGTMLPDEFAAFLENLYANVPALSEVVLGIGCCDDLSMADACAVSGVIKGAGEVKAAAYPVSCISLPKITRILASKEDICQAHCSVHTTEINRICAQVQWMCETGRSEGSPFDTGVSGSSADIVLNSHDDMDAVVKATKLLGYDLSEEDCVNVFEAFSEIVSRKESITGPELDAIVASSALQVPPTYEIDAYLINASNQVGATGLVKLKKEGQILEGVALGDGPVNAAFLAIEKIIGKHYELDDFQINSVTEGHEAMGETIVKLRSEGKLYSGRGISIDVIGASIHAYVNALNKIVYEEQE